MAAQANLRVGFVHPNLGIGGAERLVVDAAVGLQGVGHRVKVFTSHCSPSHSFPETQDGTLDVVVYGNFLPQSLLGVFWAVCAYVRVLYVAFALLLSGEKFDVLFVDQVSICIPILRFSGAKVVFYCHHPDKLLTERNNVLKALYRRPIDYLEEVTTGKADKILVNSKYTESVFRQAFPTLHHIPVEVLYPALNFKSLIAHANVDTEELLGPELVKKDIFLSINRFERKKNIQLAVEAFSVLQNLVSATSFNNVHMVLAGGYDPLLPENKEVVEELQEFVDREGLSGHVTFFKSCTEDEKAALLLESLAVVYTPANEHFGIVPIESMFFGKPVIAVNSGGPLESIIHEKTGLLCNPSAAQFAAAMNCLLKDRALVAEYGAEGKRRTRELFSLESFAANLSTIMFDVASG